MVTFAQAMEQLELELYTPTEQEGALTLESSADAYVVDKPFYFGKACAV